MITVSDLRYTYPGGTTPAVDGVSFAVEEGEIFGLLGPSGAGKSTIQGVLTRRHRRYTGAVDVLGRDLRDWDWRYYQRIGVGFEMPNHYLKLTAAENLRFFGSLYEGPVAPAEQLLGMVGLEDSAGMRVGHFSKGMMSRLGFVRALAHDPELLFLDEPTAGLDPVTAGTVKDIIRDRHEAGKTIVLTTHNMHDVDQLCDRVAFIVAGRVVAIDDPGALKLKHGKRRVEVAYQRDGADQTETFALDGLAENEDFQVILRDARISTMHSQEATLDEVFAEVTGVALDKLD